MLLVLEIQISGNCNLNDQFIIFNSEERLVIQVAKRKSECILALAQLEPIYMSPNTEEGKVECERFFPENYADTLDEDDMNFEPTSAQSRSSENETEELTQNEAEKITEVEVNTEGEDNTQGENTTRKTFGKTIDNDVGDITHVGENNE